MENWLKPEAILTALGLLGAAYAFLTGLAQYRDTQRWKRTEWTAQEMKALFADPLVQAVFLMIDYAVHPFIPLYPDQPNLSERTVSVSDGSVAHALAHHTTRGPFTRLEADIRTAFDRLLDGLERSHAYVESGLLTEADLKPYMAYWATRICPPAPSEPEPRILALQRYMDTYGFKGAHTLLRNLAQAA